MSATEAPFVPFDSEIFISQTKEQALPKEFADGWDIVTRCYRVRNP